MTKLETLHALRDSVSEKQRAKLNKLLGGLSVEFWELLDSETDDGLEERMEEATDKIADLGVPIIMAFQMTLSSEQRKLLTDLT